ncbi:MAG: histidine kinase [Acidobacteria bacterium]|nr:MAG: histidine kinase [Acidobacteriota bacterium]
MTAHKILIVDDMMQNIIILRHGLGNAGYETIWAQNGAAGVELAQKEQPDLILLDIVMPGQDGYQTIKQLKENSSTANIPVIFITAKEDLQSKLKGFELGAVDYITKPFNVYEIRARARVHIQLGMATKIIISDQAKSLEQLKKAQDYILIKPEQLPEAGFGVLYESLNEAGGDFYDVIQLASGIFGFFVGDVSGHDIGTSFVTPALKALLRQNCKIVYSPVQAMMLVNGVLKDAMPSGKYLTASYLELNRQLNRAKLVNMAHPPVIYVPKGEKPQLISNDGDVLGCFENVAFGQRVLKVQPGDRFFMYSDGIIERKKNQTVWADDLIHAPEAIEKTSDLSIQEAIIEVNASLEEKLGKADDDVLILGIEV